jgi:hypothetical protein
MNLKEYLDLVDKTADSFSKESGIGKSSIYRYCNGESIPFDKNIKKIEKLTHGKVKYKDFLDKHFEFKTRLPFDKYSMVNNLKINR